MLNGCRGHGFEGRHECAGEAADRALLQTISVALVQVLMAKIRPWMTAQRSQSQLPWGVAHSVAMHMMVRFFAIRRSIVNLSARMSMQRQSQRCRPPFFPCLLGCECGHGYVRVGDDPRSRTCPRD